MIVFFEKFKQFNNFKKQRKPIKIYRNIENNDLHTIHSVDDKSLAIPNLYLNRISLIFLELIISLLSKTSTGFCSRQRNSVSINNVETWVKRCYWYDDRCITTVAQDTRRIFIMGLQMYISGWKMSQLVGNIIKSESECFGGKKNLNSFSNNFCLQIGWSILLLVNTVVCNKCFRGLISSGT